MVMTVPELATMTVGSGINIIPDFFEDDEHKYFTVSFNLGKRCADPGLGKYDEISARNGAVLREHCSAVGKGRDYIHG